MRYVRNGWAPEDLYPMLRAENAEVVIHPDDRKYGALLVGGQGTGKCVGPHELVLLAGRLIRAEDAWKTYATSTWRDGDGWWSCPLEQPLTCALTADGRVVAAPVIRLYRQHVHESLRRIRLSDGSELMVTRRHRLRGPDEWTNDLHEGSVVCVPRRLEWPGTEVDLDLVELLAWQIAEGCETTDGKRNRMGSPSMAITQNDGALLKHVRRLVLRVGERYGLRVYDPQIFLHHRTARLTVHSADWRDFLVAHGYRWGPSAEKAIPDFIMRGDLEATRVCLRAFADAEGHVDERRGTVELTTASPLLAEQLRALLRRLGILASCHKRRACATNGSRIERDYRRLTISGDSLETFLAEVGFRYRHKDESLRRTLRRSKTNSNREGVYTQEILRRLKDIGVPFKWVSPRSWNYLYTLRASGVIAGEIAGNIRTAADRLESGSYAAPGARGVAAMKSRSATLETIDPDLLRKEAKRIDRRVEQDVLYLSVERIEEVDYQGWVYDFEVAEHHNFVAGGILAHNTAALLAFYVNDVEDCDAAPIVLDPKSELSQICLRATWPDCAKRVWFLDLGRPAFGMNPLLRPGERPLALEAAEIAENVVAALLDVYEDQIFASSRRYLYHAVIGALALAESEQRRPTFEDMHRLLEPGAYELRNRAAQACADIPDLDFSAHFLQVELPDELRLAASQTAVRMDAPRNKISTLLQVAPIRRFFHHPTNITLREIIEARDILIVDCAQGRVGDDNVKPMLMFMLRMLHRQMQRQVTLPESDRPRVPLLIDEAHYVLDVENVVDQFATHRRAGLEPACGVQYFAQIGSGSQHEEKIRKGVLNLLQSRFLFRMGDAQDAEEATRIAMAVFATMIRDDPDSRARLRVTPEQALNFPNHYCLASWISGGTRIPSFMGETYPLPDGGERWADYHLAAQAKRVDPYPETLDAAFADTAERAATDGDGQRSADGATSNGAAKREYLQVPYDEKEAAKRLGARWDPSVQRWYIPAGRDPKPFARWRAPAPETDSQPEANPPAANGTGPDPAQADTATTTAPPPQSAARRPQPPNPAARRQPPKREVRVDYEPPPPPPKLDDGATRSVLGRRVPGAAPGAHEAPAPDSLRERAFLDRVNEVNSADKLDGAARLPRLYDPDYAILALLDRAGPVPATLIRRAVFPDRGTTTAAHRLTKLYRHGLIAQHQTGLRQHSGNDGRPPLLYSLTRRGMEVAQTRQPPAISPKREWRPTEQHDGRRLRHDLHALSWGIELHRLVGELATDHWRTPRYATGRYPVPQIGSGRNRHPITLNEIPLPDKQAIIDLGLKEFTEIKPDLSLELRIPAMQVSFDLLVELDLTSRPSYNRDKLLAYDAFLCGWSLAHPRYQTQGTRPAVLFVCLDAQAVLALAREADEAMTGRIGVMGTGPEHWYHAGRDHVFFAIEADIYYDDLAALALPARPPGLRERLTGTRDLELERVTVLPDQLIKQSRGT